MRQDLAQRSFGPRRELGQREPRRAGGLGEQRARAPRLQGGRHAGGPQLPVMRQQHGRLEHLDRIAHQDDAVAPQPGIAQAGVPGERAGVCRDGAPGGLAATGRGADQDGLSRRGERIEPSPDPVDVAHRLDVARHDLRVGIGGRPLEHVSQPDHRLVADAEDDPEAGPAVGRHLVHRPCDRSALRDHADGTGHRLGGRRRAVRRDALDVVDEPLDVGPQHGKLVRERGLAQPRLELPALLARLREPARDDHDAAHAGRAALVDHAHGDSGRDDHDGEVHALRELQRRRQARPPPHLVVLGVDRIDLAVEAEVLQASMDLRGPRVGRLGGADDGDGPRGQQRLQLRGVHDAAIRAARGTVRRATRWRPSGPARA